MPDDATSNRVLRRDIQCPRCRYSLYGLPGPKVTCPECGLTCDLESLLRTGGKYWWEGKTYSRLAADSLVSVFGTALLGSILLPASLAIGHVSGAVIVLLSMLVLCALFTQRLRGLPRPLEAFGLCLLLMVTFAGYGIFSLLAAGGAVMVMLTGMRLPAGGSGQVLAFSFGLLVVAVGVLFLLVRLDRFVGNVCLRRDADAFRAGISQGGDA